MYLAYNTNGLAHHRLRDALHLLADTGYQGVALTPDVGHLDLARREGAAPDERAWERTRALLDDLELRCVIETGARYVLDRARKHWPNLLTQDPAAAERRMRHYWKCARMAVALDAPLISLWSGAPEAGDTREAAFDRLLERLHRVLDDAGTLGIQVAFEPEPGMLVGSLADYRELRQRLGRDDLKTTLDVGHLLVTEQGAAHEHLAEFADTLVNVHLDDSHRGAHEHLPLGEGEVDVAAVIAELRRLEFDGPLALELSRDSHRGAAMVRQSYEYVQPLLQG